jgi:hypothetical protein
VTGGGVPMADRSGGGGGARRQEVSRQGGRSSPGPVAAARGEEATGVAGLVGGGAEGRVRWK